MYVYIRSERQLYTVGFYDPQGNWHADSDYDNTRDAAARVHYLNGGGEESQEECEPEEEQPRAYQDYNLTTHPDGSISGETTTNDNNDDGYPDGNIEHWPVFYRNREEMLKRTGGTHTGCSGIKVTVYLDGVQL